MMNINQLKEIENQLMSTYSKVELYAILENIEAYTDCQFQSVCMPWNPKNELANEITDYLKRTYCNTTNQAIHYIIEKNLNPDNNQINSLINSHGHEPWGLS